MKKLIALLLALMTVLSLVACGEETTTNEQSEAEETVIEEEVTEETVDENAITSTESTDIEVDDVVIETNSEDIVMPEAQEIPETKSFDQIEDVPEDAEASALGEDTLLGPKGPADKAPGGQIKPKDPYRPSYDLGLTRQLENDIYVLGIFIDDAESSWTKDERLAFQKNKLYPGVNWLKDQAKVWGSSFDYEYGYYSQEIVKVRYNGTIKNFNPSYSADLLDQAATSMGFANKEAMHKFIKDYSKKSQVVYMIIVDKPGRCYAWMDTYNDGSDLMEYCVLFDDNLYLANNSYYACFASTVAHEMLHLFGAEDFYSDGTTRAKRYKLVEKNYKNSIMNSAYENLSYNYVDQFTAYTVGWTDVTPNVCYNNDWWN